MLAVLAEGVLDLGLFEHGVDAAQPIGGRVGHRANSAQRVVKISDRFAVCPASLRFLAGQNGVVDRFFSVVAEAEM